MSKKKPDKKAPRAKTKKSMGPGKKQHSTQAWERGKSIKCAPND